MVEQIEGNATKGHPCLPRGRSYPVTSIKSTSIERAQHRQQLRIIDKITISKQVKRGIIRIFNNQMLKTMCFIW
jgi:hypothetical protein